MLWGVKIRHSSRQFLLPNQVDYHIFGQEQIVMEILITSIINMPCLPQFTMENICVKSQLWPQLTVCRLNLHPQFDPIVSIIFSHITPNECITIVIP